MGNDLPERLRIIAESVDDWNAPLCAKVDLIAAAKRIEALEDGLKKAYLGGITRGLFSPKNIDDVKKYIEDSWKNSRAKALMEGGKDE